MHNKLTLPPEREAIEREVSELFHNGDFTDIARLIHVQHSTVSRSFSTTDETRLNPVFQIIIYLWAFDQIRDGLADTVLSIIERERAKWMPQMAVANCPVRLTTDIGKEFNEFLEKKLEGASWNVQIKECMDIEDAAKKKRAWLIEQRNLDHFNGKPVSYSTRNEVRMRIAK
jgi:hypothetical protein